MFGRPLEILRHRTGKMDFLKKNARKSRSLQFESLENRELLASNPLCTLTAYAQTDNPAEIRFTVSTGDAKPASFEFKAYGGGTLDPSEIELRDADSKVLSFSSVTDGTKTSTSIGTISLAPGSYTAYVYADSGTAGNLTFEIAQIPSAVPGLAYLVEAAILQQQDGWATVRSSYTKLLEPYFGWGAYENLNTTKQAMLDLNGDGKITVADLELARTPTVSPTNSATITTAIVVPQDLTPPTISLVLKTGTVSGTTDPTLTGKITDASGIKAGSTQYSINNGVSWTALSLDANGNYTIPASAFTTPGTYTVVVRTADTKGNTGTASLTLTHIGTSITNPTINDNGTGQVSLGSGLQVLTVNGTTFPTNNQITVPGKGTVIKNADGTLSFVVDPNYYNCLPKGTTTTVSVTVISQDAVGNTHTTPVEFKFDVVNNPPVPGGAVLEKITLNQGTENFITHATLLSNWSDPDFGTVLTVKSASIDSVTCSNGSIKTYTAAYLASCLSNQNGRITFTATDSMLKELGQDETLTVQVAYTVSDGDGAVATDYITFVINGINDKPTAENFTIALTTFPYTISQADILSKGNALDVNANDKGKLIVSSVGVQSGTGAVTYVNGILTFMPDAATLAETPVEQELVTVLAYTVADGHGGTVTATITLKYNGTKKTYTASASSVTQIKINGAVVYSGSGQTFSYGEKTINVPTVIGNGQTLNESFQFVQNPVLSDTSFLPADIVAEFTVRYDILLNGGATGSKGTITVFATGVNVQPTVAIQSSPSVKEDRLATINLADHLAIIDPNVGDNHTVQSIAGNRYTGGTLMVELASGAIVSYSGNDLNITYNPNGIFDRLSEGVVELDVLTFTITDGKTNGESAPVTLNVRIVGVNSPPVFDNTVPTFTVMEGADKPRENISFDKLLENWNDKDHARSELNIKDVRLDSVEPDGLIPLTVLQNTVGLFVADSNGRCVLFDTAQEIFRKLGAGQFVELTFSYTTFDPDGGEGTGSFKIVVNGTNDPPSFTVQKTSFELRNNSNAPVLTLDPDCGNIADVDLNDVGALTFALDAASLSKGFSIDKATGKISIGNADLAKLSGNDTITILLNDAHGGSSSCNVAISIGPEPNPTVANRTFEVSENDPAMTDDLMKAVTKTTGRTYSIDTIPVLRSGTLPNGVDVGDVATIDENGVFTFTPGTYFQFLAAGETSNLVFEFTVAAADFVNCTTTATITVTVVGKNNPPKIAGDSLFFVTNSGKEPGMFIDITTFDALDVDLSDVHTWSLGSVAWSDEDKFAPLPTFHIDAETGRLTLTNTNLSLAPGKSAAFTLTVCLDDGTETVEKEIFVTVYAKQTPVVERTPNDLESSSFTESDSITAEWIIDVTDPAEPFAVPPRPGNDWFDIRNLSITMNLNGKSYTNSNIDLTALGCVIAGNADDGFKLVFRPIAGLFDFLNKDDILTLQIGFEVCDTEYLVTKIESLDLTICGEASQHSVSVGQDSFTVWTNRRIPDSFAFNPDYKIADIDRSAVYGYSISGISVTLNPAGLSEAAIRSFFTINETTGEITLAETAAGNFVCEITISVSKDGVQPVEKILTVTVRTAETPTAPEISGAIDENGEFIGTPPTFHSESGKHTLSELTLPTSVEVSSGRSLPWTDDMSDCLTFDATTGKFTFRPHGIFDFLAADEMVILEFTYTISDDVYDVSAIGVIRLKINGKNNDPVVYEDTVYGLFLPVNLPGGHVYYLDELASDVDFSDKLTFLSLTIDGDTRFFDAKGQVFFEDYGLFLREVDAEGRELLRFLPDPNRTGSFSKLIAGKMDMFELDYTVTDGKKTANGTIVITVKGVNHLPQTTETTSSYTESLETILHIDLSEHFTDADLESDDWLDSLDFKIQQGLQATNTFIKEVNIEDGQLVVAYVSLQEFKGTTNTTSVSIVVEAHDRYAGTCTKTFMFSMEDAQTIKLSVIPLKTASDGATKPESDIKSITGGWYYIEVWASDLFANGNGGTYTISFGLNTDPTAFTYKIEQKAGTVLEQSNGIQSTATGITIPADGDVLLLRIKVTPTSEAKVVPFELGINMVKRDNETVHASQICSTPITVTHGTLTPATAPVVGAAFAINSWGPNAMDLDEHSLFVNGLTPSVLPMETPPNEEFSWGNSFGFGNPIDSPFAQDFDPFHLIGDIEDVLADYLLQS